MDLQRFIDSVHPTLVEIYAPWCPHCRKMMPIVEDLKEIYSGRAHIVQIDGDSNPDIAQAFKAESYPTWILYKEGEEVWRDSGEKPASELEDMIDRFV